jgi:hypothetical protein
VESLLGEDPEAAEAQRTNALELAFSSADADAGRETRALDPLAAVRAGAGRHCPSAADRSRCLELEEWRRQG